MLGESRNRLAVPIVDPRIRGAQPHTPPEWTDRSVCATAPDPDLWFAKPGTPAERQARVLCFTCPVRVECLEAAKAAGEEFGVFGGHQFHVQQVPVCGAGHELTDDNIVSRKGRAVGRCKTCLRDAATARRKRQREAEAA